MSGARERSPAVRLIGSAVVPVLALGIAAGVLGQVVRDRSVGWALLMDLPLVPIGLAAVAWDAIRRGRALPGPRFGLGALGLAAALGAGWPAAAPPSASRPRFRRAEPAPAFAIVILAGPPDLVLRPVIGTRTAGAIPRSPNRARFSDSMVDG